MRADRVKNAQSEVEAFADFAERLSARENAAATELLERYSHRIVRIAGQQLGRRFNPKVDAEDVLQSVLRTFYRRLHAGEVELRDWASLSGLLSLLTLRKCQRQVERFSTAGRDVNREVSLSCKSNVATIIIPDREPTPLEVAAFMELVEKMLSRSIERDRRIIGLIFAGNSVDTIAAEIGCSRRTVYRTLSWMRQELISAEFDDAEGSAVENLAPSVFRSAGACDPSSVCSGSAK
jgi:RNA polymerase sigma factor (sigma-70 family)